MAQRTPAAGFADTGIEKAAAKSASAGKTKSVQSALILEICDYRTTATVLLAALSPALLTAFTLYSNCTPRGWSFNEALFVAKSAITS